MKKIIGYYYDDEDICLFTLDTEKLEYSKALEKKHIKINIESKEVQKAHSFFQDAIIEDSINCTFENYEMDYSGIESEEFFDDDFKKLTNFLEKQVEVVNTTLEGVKTTYEGDVEE